MFLWTLQILHARTSQCVCNGTRTISDYITNAFFDPWCKIQIGNSVVPAFIVVKTISVVILSVECVCV